MQGTRVAFRAGFPSGFRTGDYCKVPASVDPRPGQVWYAMAPNGDIGAILQKHHTVAEHEDGTITVTPSLVMPGGWHGFLHAGVWSEV